MEHHCRHEGQVGQPAGAIAPSLTAARAATWQGLGSVAGLDRAQTALAVAQLIT